MKEAQRLVSDFIEDRPVLKENNQDPHRMAELLQNEVDELKEVIDNPEEAAKELVDVLFFCLSIATLHGIDVDEAFKTKAARNHLKRPAYKWQEGDYYQIDRECREDWEAQGGDEAFYG